MIGQAWPIASTGYSVLEQGEIDRQTLRLSVQAYLVADPRGNTFAEQYLSYAEAERAAMEFARIARLAKP